MSFSHQMAEQIARLRDFPSAKGIPQDQQPQSSNLFVYCSTPRPVHDMEVEGGLYGRPLYRNNVKKPEGWHSYYNISWDPRVRRGDPLQARKRRDREECEKIRKMLIQPRKINSLRKANKESTIKTADSRTSDPQVMIRTANMRYARLAISNLRPKEKDAFFVDLVDELDQDELCYRGQRIGAAKVLPKAPANKKNLVDQASQIWPGEFFNFDREVVPVLERLIGAVCYQARLEVLEEAELEALRMERQMFEDKKVSEEDDVDKLKNRLEMQIKEQKRQLQLAREHAKDGVSGKVAYSLFAGVYMKYSMDEAMEAMGEDWRANERIQAAIEGEFNSWINAEVDNQMELFYQATVFLDGMIRRVVTEREAEYAAQMWKDHYSEEQVRIFSQVESTSKVPPPTPGSSEYYTSDEEGLIFPSTSNYYGSSTTNND